MTESPVTETFETETPVARSPLSGSPVVFPQDRACPYAPPPGYEPLRASGRPVSRVEIYDGSEVWMVSGLAEARALLADQRLSSDRSRPEFPVFQRRLEKVERRRVELLGVDDPEHNVQRRKLIPGFTLKRTAALRPAIQETVDRLLDEMVERGAPADLVSAFALPVPSMVICALLGVPYADHDFFEEQSRKLLRGPEQEDVETARDALDAYIGDLVERKQAGAQGLPVGLLDDMIDVFEDREELVNLAEILLIAGHETTANMIALGTFTLLEHPEQLARFRAADDAGVVAACEELLRYLSIADGMARLATEDIEIAGVTIRAGETVVLATSLINRDPATFEAPDALDVERRERHLAFGFGIHQCLGQNLARAEMEIALGTLFRRLPGLRLAVPAAEVPHKPGDTIQGLFELPVTW
ncbi:cytochrome P450 [Streptomyces candidus]|uniref:Pentalenic acid synthase n=1 Tax=Streptomyces candidus TaxID=67283 RepID=A0A7X0HBZ0_9ACTN|nr:pentalenic acid synthase [Streptomyces candidus]GHH41854.1 cytochrome P450 [Streptomyces candidus]